MQSSAWVHEARENYIDAPVGELASATQFIRVTVKAEYAPLDIETDYSSNHFCKL